jgi:hypothetical protein
MLHYKMGISHHSGTIVLYEILIEGEEMMNSKTSSTSASGNNLPYMDMRILYYFIIDVIC